MWRAVGSPPSKKPSEWARQSAAKEFIESLADSLSVGITHLWKSKVGHKLSRGLPARARTRDHLNTLELAALRFAEAMAEMRIKDGCIHGNGPCCSTCREAGVATYQAMAAMGLATES